MPVFGTGAATFNDDGVTGLYQHLAGLLAEHSLPLAEGMLPAVPGHASTSAASVIPPARAAYLAEIAATVRGYHEQTARQAAATRLVQRLAEVHAEPSADTEQTAASTVPGAAPARIAEDAVSSLVDRARRDVTCHRSVGEVHATTDVVDLPRDPVGIVRQQEDHGCRNVTRRARASPRICSALAGALDLIERV